jgi:hypothetical protein
MKALFASRKTASPRAIPPLKMARPLPDGCGTIPNLLDLRKSAPRHLWILHCRGSQESCDPQIVFPTILLRDAPEHDVFPTILLRDAPQHDVFPTILLRDGPQHDVFRTILLRDDPEHDVFRTFSLRDARHHESITTEDWGPGNKGKDMEEGQLRHLPPP